MSRFLESRLVFMKMIFSAFVIICVENPVEARRMNSEIDEFLVNWAGYGEEKLSTVVISGKLLCDAGANPNPSPVSGASVAVFCGTNGSRKKSWEKGSTDIYGEFVIDLPSELHAIPNLEKMCQVKVLHLPKKSPCGQAFTSKHTGIQLISIGEGIRTYTANDIHLMPKSYRQHKRSEGKQELTTMSVQ